MKSFRVLILLGVVPIVLAGMRFWPGRTSMMGAATAAEGVENYYESLKSGDRERYLLCLGEPYRGEAGQRFFDTACRDVKDIKGVVPHARADENGSLRWVDVEEVAAGSPGWPRFSCSASVKPSETSSAL